CPILAGLLHARVGLLFVFPRRRAGWSTLNAHARDVPPVPSSGAQRSISLVGARYIVPVLQVRPTQGAPGSQFEPGSCVYFLLCQLCLARPPFRLCVQAISQPRAGLTSQARTQPSATHSVP